MCNGCLRKKNTITEPSPALLLLLSMTPYISLGMSLEYPLGQLCWLCPLPTPRAPILLAAVCSEEQKRA